MGSMQELDSISNKLKNKINKNQKFKIIELK